MKHYNSTMVSIQMKLQQSSFSARIMSQFHYGSIQMYKNPKEKNEIVMSQFHYGSIQINSVCIIIIKTRLCLNSTMVRFKSSWSSYDDLRVIVSQFHYGSIQIETTLLKICRSYQVSIPLWFDSNT